MMGLVFQDENDLFHLGINMLVSALFSAVMNQQHDLHKISHECRNHGKRLSNAITTSIH